MDSKLSPKQADEWMSKVFYKPGFKFESFMDGGGRLCIRITMIGVTDSTTFPVDDSVKVNINKNCYPPEWCDNEREFLDWLGRELIGLEIHECKEWFRLVSNGKPLDDPHKYDRR